MKIFSMVIIVTTVVLFVYSLWQWQLKTAYNVTKSSNIQALINVPLQQSAIFLLIIVGFVMAAFFVRSHSMSTWVSMSFLGIAFFLVAKLFFVAVVQPSRIQDAAIRKEQEDRQLSVKPKAEAFKKEMLGYIAGNVKLTDTQVEKVTEDYVELSLSLVDDQFSNDTALLLGAILDKKLYSADTFFRGDEKSGENLFLWSANEKYVIFDSISKYSDISYNIKIFDKSRSLPDMVGVARNKDNVLVIKKLLELGANKKITLDNGQDALAILEKKISRKEQSIANRKQVLLEHPEYNTSLDQEVTDENYTELESLNELQLLFE